MAVRFETLWKNHPYVKGDAPLLDKQTYQNQCAISMHACLERSGMNLQTFQGARSWQKDKPKYALRAQELADWLATAHSNMRPVQKFSGKEVFEKIDGKMGIIFFQNYWGVGNQGDHIDLWNRSRLTDWFTWIRIHARIGTLGIHTISPLSDFKKSQSVWFWNVS